MAFANKCDSQTYTFIKILIEKMIIYNTVLHVDRILFIKLVVVINTKIFE